MRNVQKVLTGIFLSGILIGGVGTGIAMVEYSSLVYGGEKLIPNFGLIMLCSLIAIGTGGIVAIFNDKKKK